MNTLKKNRIVSIGLILLGISISVIGVASLLVPPIITGLGFFLIAWAFHQ